MITEQKYGVISIDQIKLNPNNPRSIKKDKLEQLKKSIREFPEMLELRPIIINEEGYVLGGNMRLTALKELGYTEVPYHRVDDLTLEQQREFIIKDNLSFGEWDWDILEAEWEKELLLDWGLNIPDNKFVQTDEAVEDDYVGALPQTTDIKFGDLIEIGDHRLMCGDSTDPEQMRILMNGQKADIFLTDPPYGVSYKGADFEVIKNDHLRDEPLYQLLVGAFKNAYEYTKNDIGGYVWFIDDDKHIVPALEECGFEVKQKLVWVKGMVLGRSDYHYSHEACRYIHKKNQKTNWYGDRTQKTIFNMNEREVEQLKKEDLVKIVKNIIDGSDVWEIRKDNVNTYVHPTQKPVTLSGKMINNTTPQGGLCLDLFLGSGSAMVAAHQLGRRMYGMELDPKYCQVIIDRMRQLDTDVKIKINGTEYKTN